MCVRVCARVCVCVLYENTYIQQEDLVCSVVRVFTIN